MTAAKRAPVRLTARGKAMLVAAGVGAVAAYVLGWPALLAIAAFVCAIVAVGAIAVHLSPTRLEVERSIDPNVAAAGVPVDVRIVVRGDAAASAWHDAVSQPSEVFGVTSGVLPAMRFDDGPVEFGYAVSGRRRGILQLGPVRIDRTDPFGVVVARRTTGAPSTLTVLPTVHPVSPPVVHARADLDPADSVAAGIAGDHRDVIAREYRAGDALRNVDWRSTARRGELMVRAETAVVATSTAVLFDVRDSVWPYPEQFEWAIECVASLLSAAADHRATVRLVVDALTRPAAGLDVALRELAVVAPVASSATLTDLVRLAGTTDSQVLHLVTGAAAAAEIRDLPRPIGGTAGVVSVVQGVERFGRHGVRADTIPAPSGWRLAVLNPALPVTRAWQAHE